MSTRFDFAMARKATEKQYGLESGAYLKIKEGANKIRLLSAPIGHMSTFKGKSNFKYVAWVYDYAEQKVRLYFMPATIYKAIEALQTSEGYEFDELPMPYDITVNADGAGTKEVKYQITAARQNTDLPDECKAQLVNKESIEEVIKKLQEKEAKPELSAAEAAAQKEKEQAEIKAASETTPFWKIAQNFGAG